jgi:hypothetical protein
MDRGHYETLGSVPLDLSLEAGIADEINQLAVPIDALTISGTV